MIDTTAARISGRLAARRGAGRQANPHPAQTRPDLHKAWDQGFTEAAAHRIVTTKGNRHERA